MYNTVTNYYYLLATTFADVLRELYVTVQFLSKFREPSF